MFSFQSYNCPFQKSALVHAFIFMELFMILAQSVYMCWYFDVYMCWYLDVYGYHGKSIHFILEQRCVSFKLRIGINNLKSYKLANWQSYDKISKIIYQDYWICMELYYLYTKVLYLYLKACFLILFFIFLCLSVPIYKRS